MKYIIYYMVVDKTDAIMFEEKYIDYCEIETSECLWVPIRILLSDEFKMKKQIPIRNITTLCLRLCEVKK